MRFRPARLDTGFGDGEILAQVDDWRGTAVAVVALLEQGYRRKLPYCLDEAPGKWIDALRALSTEILMIGSTLMRLLGRMEYYSRSERKFYPWGFAMNGMASRLEATRQIIHALQIEGIVEAGTYRGTTTEWLAQFKLPIETVEISERFWAFAKARLAKFSNVVVTRSSSVPFLRERTTRVSRDARELYYLDSHWNDHLPLREELELIFNNFSQSVVLVDDFEVKDDEGYGFDDYAPDKRLTLAYLKAASLPPLFRFYPATRSHEESGARRGWIVLTASPELATKLSYISLLREAPEQ